jgi:glycosyltransferase involved in cell wall biosynthesis
MPTEVSAADVTVMVCAYNAEETLGATLASIAAQTVQPGSVVVLDDASTDGTTDVARSWRSRLPIELVALEVNGGHPHARVVAQEHCRTELIAIVDADDAWLPDHLETLLVAYRNTPGVIVARELLWIRGSRLAPAEGPERDVPVPRHQLRRLLRSDYLPIGTLFARADLLRAGGFREVMPEDWDLWIRMIRLGVVVTGANHPTYVYRIHHSSSSFGEKYARYNVETLERALAEATSEAERRAARRGLTAARAREQLTLAYRTATDGDHRAARTHALRAWRGGPKVAARAAFIVAAPRVGSRIHDRRLNDLSGWIDP